MAWLWAPSEHLFWDLVWAATRQLCSLLNAPHRRFRRGGGRGKVHDEGSCKDVLSLRRCSGTVSLSLLLSCTRRINGSTCVIKLKKEKNSNSNSKRIKQIREIAAVVGRQRPSPRQLDLSFFFFFLELQLEVRPQTDWQLTFIGSLGMSDARRRTTYASALSRSTFNAPKPFSAIVCFDFNSLSFS